MSDVTRILGQIESGDPKAAEQLLPLVYEELRKLAAAKMAQEKPGQTLQATALVHEAYLRLVDVDSAELGTAAVISSPPPPRPCGGSSSTRPGASSDRSTAAIASRRPRRRGSPPIRCRTTICWRSTRRWQAGEREARQGRARQAPLLRRADHEEAAEVSGSPANRRRRSGVTPRLAPRELKDRAAQRS